MSAPPADGVEAPVPGVGLPAAEDRSDDLAPPPVAGGLLPGVLGRFSLAMQGISFVGPAFSGLLLFQVVAGYAGVAVAFAFLVAGLIIVMMALSLGVLAARIPSAGGYITYVSRALHAKAGALLGWIFTVYAPISPGFIVAFTGWVCEEALKDEYGFDLPWWVFLVVAVAVVTVVVHLGIRISARTLVVLGAIETALVLCLAVWGFFRPGPGGLSALPLSPSSATGGIHGLYLGVVFSLFAFAGWEGSTPLAEESREPRRSVPVGLVASVVTVVVVFVVTSWGLMVGWGVKALPSLISSPASPPIVLAHRFWGAAWVLVLLALLNSVVCAAIASFNTVTRVWFSMGRAGLGPRQLATLHPRYRTPTVAIGAQALLTLGVGLGFGLWLGPLNAFLTLSLLTTLALVAIYVLCNLAVLRLAARGGAHGRKVWRYVVFPVLTTTAVVWVGYKSLVPLPPAPIRWAAIGGAVWLVIGFALLGTRHARRYVSAMVPLSREEEALAG